MQNPSPRRPFFVFVLSMSLVIVAASASARSEARPACVFSPDGVVLHRPGGAPCGNEERAERVRVRARQTGTKTEFDESTAIPPADPMVPVDVLRLAGKGPFLPAKPGTRALFRRSLKRTLYAGPHLSAKFHYQGDRIEEVFAASKGKATAEIRVTDRLMGERGLADISDTQRHYVVPGTTRYEPIASEMAVRGKRVVVRQPEGTTPIMKGAKPGKPWPAGVEVIDGLAFEREGEVMGVQALDTPAGRFEQVLVVRYTGKLMKPGLSPLGDGVRVKGGRVVTTEWIARGVGRVQIRQEGELELGQVDDMPGRLTFESLGQLDQLQRPASRRTSDLPAAPDRGARAENPWQGSTFELSHDPALPLGAPLPEELVRFRKDGAVEIVAQGRRLAMCQAKTHPKQSDLLRLTCRDLASAQELRFDFIASAGRRVLTSATGSQYSRQK